MKIERWTNCSASTAVFYSLFKSIQSITRTKNSWIHNINNGRIKDMAKETRATSCLHRALGRFHLISRNAVIGRLGLVITRTSCWIVVCRSTTVSSKSWSAPFLATSEIDIGTPSLPTGITTCRYRPCFHHKLVQTFSHWQVGGSVVGRLGYFKFQNLQEVTESTLDTKSDTHGLWQPLCLFGLHVVQHCLAQTKVPT